MPRLAEFGQRGFHESSIVGIARRAKVALGTFYTYFDSKEAVFAALVSDMSGPGARLMSLIRRSKARPTTLDGERRALAAYLRFVFDHARKSTGSSTKPNSSIRRIPRPLRDRRPTAIAARLKAATEKGEVAIMGELANGVQRPGR